MLALSQRSGARDLAARSARALRLGRRPQHSCRRRASTSVLKPDPHSTIRRRCRPAASDAERRLAPPRSLWRGRWDRAKKMSTRPSASRISALGCRPGQRYWLCSLATRGVPARAARAAAHHAPNMCAWTRSAAASLGPSHAAKRGFATHCGFSPSPRSRSPRGAGARAGCRPGSPSRSAARADPVAAQLDHHAQHRKLRAARLELGDDSRDEHDPTTNGSRRAVACQGVGSAAAATAAARHT
jgi:hypothetical protein